MTVLYLDSSAIAKLAFEEDGSDILAEYIESCDVVSSDVALTEVTRTARRIASEIPANALGDLLEKTMIAMEEMMLIMVETRTLVRAGAIEGSFLRSIDAIHIATAQGLGDVDAFVTYDERQAAAARLAGFRTISPGV
ncbi:MAG: type II toxin-antitoxin system VapC family toxin [Actinobacteria bacterium]|nr:type II toxin-antitoxin system VapC family toxin [Actinomycetota bacterium]